ncbi:hypothetical protein LTS17_009592 [Exophiala oligosperma]
MRVAIAGAGDLARYFCEEFLKAGHQVTILTRSEKEYLKRPNVNQVITDYTLDSVSKAIADCEALISAVLDYSMGYKDLHLTLLEACQKSPKCKRFIPSEFAGDIKHYPHEPPFYADSHEPVREALRNQQDVEWTLVCAGWFMDYVVPPKNRHLKEIGETFPIDLSTNRAVIPGTGKEPVDITAVRDVARAVTALLEAPRWEPYTFVSGQKTCWLDVFEVMRARHPDMKPTFKSLEQLVEERNSPDKNVSGLAEYQIFSCTGPASLEAKEADAQRTKYFKGIQIRTLVDFLEEYDQNPDAIL